MSRVIETYNSISFRGRLLALLIVVGLVQAGVAALTFNSLQSKPVDERIQAQLTANLRAIGPMIDDELKGASARLRTLSADEQLVAAVVAGDRITADEILSNSVDGAAAIAIDAGRDEVSGEVSAEPFTAAFITDTNEEVIAGTRPEGVLIEQEGLTTSTLRQGAKLIGILHVPVVVDRRFLTDRVGTYVSKGVTVFVVDDEQVSTVAGVAARPKGVGDGTRTLELDGNEQRAYLQPVLDGAALVGAAVPTSLIASEKRESFRNLAGFIFALIALTIVVSIGVSRSVSGALRKFAGLTEDLAAGQLSRRIPVTGDDEIAVLSESFNDMAENLEQRIESLIEARAAMRRQVDLFGEALANATDIGEMLHAVCGLAMESTSATHVRFWTIDEDGHYVHSANIGLRVTDKQPCSLERAVSVRGATVRSDGSPQWMVVPARANDKIIGLLTLVSADKEFTEDDSRIAERLAVQAAVAIENARLHELLRLQATRDGLTGLPNHRSLQDALTKMIDAAYSKHQPLGVALLDIDNFKRVNDTFGHKIGDEAIKALARVLDHGVGELGMAARYGGEEFVVLLPGCDSSAACRIADRLREDITHIEVPLEDGNMLTFTASFGVANVDQNRELVENAELLRQADVGLYNAKRTGKNRVVLATPQMEVVEMGEAEKAALAARERGEDVPAQAA